MRFVYRQSLVVLFVLWSAEASQSAEFFALGFRADPDLYAYRSLNVTEDGAVVVGRAVSEVQNAVLLDIVKWTRQAGAEIQQDTLSSSANSCED